MAESAYKMMLKYMDSFKLSGHGDPQPDEMAAWVFRTLRDGLGHPLFDHQPFDAGPFHDYDPKIDLSHYTAQVAEQIGEFKENLARKEVRKALKELILEILEEKKEP